MLPLKQNITQGAYSIVGTPRVEALNMAETVQGINGSRIVTESSIDLDKLSGTRFLSLSLSKLNNKDWYIGGEIAPFQ